MYPAPITVTRNVSIFTRTIVICDYVDLNIILSQMYELLDVKLTLIKVITNICHLSEYTSKRT